ncbi:unnamed protein product [Mucor circinelloides]|uniref:Uncharacterized protein n=1 Tax=Mucor circinelloides f. circinelloides (strain 1006PhL) TaxID=1220926 RepID=S2JFD6_MUCC1|nr:hypothetical protein HMPREF1544_04232 [Mucor circinelloides 1006PhL]
MSTVEIYNKANESLDTLSNLWQTMLQIIQAVSLASAASLTVEPDLAKLQKTRKEYEQLMTTLKTNVAWLEKNQLNESELDVETETYTSGLVEQDILQKESTRVNDQLKRLLNQSYALQFQLEMLFTSSQDIKLN